jgi:hypothetical protein
MLNRIKSIFLGKPTKTQIIILIILLHLILGMLVVIFPIALGISALLVFIAGLLFLLKTENKDGTAHYVAAYMIGFGAFTKMQSAVIHLGYNFDFFTILIILGLAILIEKKINKSNVKFLIFFLLLLPSLFLTNLDYIFINKPWNPPVSSSLLGPLTLTIAAVYFFNRKFGLNDLSKLALYAVIPLFSMIGLVIFNVKDFFKEGLMSAVFSGTSESYKTVLGFSPTTSGLMPTEFALAMCFGAVLFAACLILNASPTGNKILDYSILGCLLVSALLSFSRGALFAFIASILAGLFVLNFDQGIPKNFKKKMMIGLIVMLSLLILMLALNHFTEGKIYARYQSTFEGLKEGDVLSLTSKRILFIKTELETFQNNILLGIGPGMLKETYDREDLTRFNRGLPHTEYSRLLAEHGIFGIAALIMIIGIPVVCFFREKNTKKRTLLAIFISFALIMMAFEALRPIQIAFIYGLIFICLNELETEQN